MLNESYIFSPGVFVASARFNLEVPGALLRACRNECCWGRMSAPPYITDPGSDPYSTSSQLFVLASGS